MKKGLLITGVVILVLIAALVFSLGHIIKAGIETAGPKFAQVPMSVANVRLNLFTGTVHIKDLIVGNPEGFNTPSAMELGELDVDIAMSSLFSDTIVIKKILIDAPQITYEKSLKSSNLSALQANLAPKDAKKPAGEPAPEKKEGADMNVVIEDFQLNGAKVHVTITALGGKKMTLPLPDIQMKDIGKESGGASLTEVLSETLGAVSKAVVDAVASTGGIAGDALKKVGGTATDASSGAVDAAKGAANSIKKGVGGLFGK